MSIAVSTSASNTGANRSITLLMLHVLLATVPGTCAMVYFFGWGVVLNIVSLIVWALLLEAFVLKLRAQDLRLPLRDLSAVVTAVLLALALPPTAPWWLGLTGCFFAIVVAKHVYGGLGCNPFNPAMVGYAVLVVAFPLPMTRWLLPTGATAALPSFSEAFTLLRDGELLQGIDAYVGATALDSFRLQADAQLVGEFMESSVVAGSWAGLGWEWINVGFLFGGLYLLYKRLISWHIPAAFLLALATLAFGFHDGGSSASHGSPLWHLFGGATMLGAFFIATDPVTAATTPRGKLVYGALIGATVFGIRAFGNYPDGIAFAVLIGNMAAPLIDTLMRPATAGHSQ